MLKDCGLETRVCQREKVHNCWVELDEEVYFFFLVALLANIETTT